MSRYRTLNGQAERDRGEPLPPGTVTSFFMDLVADMDIESIAPPLPAEEIERRRLAMETVKAKVDRAHLTEQAVAAAHAPLAESPIERALGPYILLGATPSKQPSLDGSLCTLGPWTLYAQHPIGPYRADLAVVGEAGRVVIECDGHEWHERTREQAAHDRRRDRYMQIEGWRVLRFTGREIHRDAGACLEEIQQLLARLTTWAVR